MLVLAFREQRVTALIVGIFSGLAVFKSVVINHNVVYIKVCVCFQGTASYRPSCGDFQRTSRSFHFCTSGKFSFVPPGSFKQLSITQQPYT